MSKQVSSASVLALVCVSIVLFNTASSACFGDTPLRDWPVVSRGDKDNNVRVVQLLLTAHGNLVAADGVFGQATQKVLKQFQQAHSLIAKGQTNDPTWEALLITTRLGSKGPAVKAAQYELRDVGYAVPVNGDFDNKLRVVVQQYQKSTGHTADGVVGRNTWHELLAGGPNQND